MNCPPYELIFIALIASMIRWYAWLYKVQPAFLRVLFSGKIFVVLLRCGSACKFCWRILWENDFGYDVIVGYLRLSHTLDVSSPNADYSSRLLSGKMSGSSLVLRVKLPKTIRTTRASLGRRPSRSSRLAPNPFPRCRVVLLRFEDS